MKTIDTFNYFRMFAQNYYYYLVRKEILSKTPDKKPTNPNTISFNPNIKYNRDNAVFAWEKGTRPDSIDKIVFEKGINLYNREKVEYLLLISHDDKKILDTNTNTDNSVDSCSVNIPDDFKDIKKEMSSWHNHPSGWLSDYSEKGHGGTCFSPPDWNIFIKYSFKRMYVSNPLFLYRVIKPIKPVDHTKAYAVLKKHFWENKSNGDIYLELPFIKICKELKFKWKRFLINTNAPCINLFSKKINSTELDIKGKKNG